MLICLDMRTGAGCGTQTVDEASFCEDCGQNLHFALRLHNSNTFVERYRILQVIGYGGFGAVYKALTPSRKRVALKETFDLSSISTFKREFAVLSRLSHVNLPRYIDMFEAGGHGYLVMEYVPGQSLQDILDEKAAQVLSERLPESQVLGYTIQLCDVLHYLHSQQPPILHRDIKPANIRLTPEGRIKLVDFGLLKQGGQQTRATIRGLGTSGYAPIEQYADNQQGTNPRSDIYALGATLYHLLSGNEPLSAPTRIASMPDSLPILPDLRPDVSLHVANTIAKAMSLLPKDRFANTMEMKQALLGAIQAKIKASDTPTPRANRPPTHAPIPSRRPSKPVETPITPTSPLEEVTNWFKRTLFPSLIPDTTEKAPQPITPRVLRPTPPPPVNIVPAPHELSLPHVVCDTQHHNILSIAYTPSGDKLIGMSVEGTLYEWAVSDGSLVQTHELPDLRRVRHFAYSPTGETFTTISADNQVRIWNGQNRQVIHTLDSNKHQKKDDLCYSPDGKRLVTIVRQKQMINMWQVSDGTLLYSRKDLVRESHGITFSPNSSMFATGGSRESSKIHIIRAADGQLLGKMKRRSAAYCMAWHPNGKVLASGDDAKVEVWGIKTGRRLQKMIGHSGRITHLLWHPSGGFVISASKDQTVCVWTARGSVLLYQFSNHFVDILGLAIAPDGRTLAIASEDKTVRLWQFPTYHQI